MLKIVPSMAGLKVSCAEDMEQEESGECEGTGELVWLQLGNRCRDKDVSRDAKQIPRLRKARRKLGSPPLQLICTLCCYVVTRRKVMEETTNSCIYI